MRPSSKTAERSLSPSAALVELLPLPPERLDESRTSSIRCHCRECSWPKIWPCSKTAEPSLSPRAGSVQLLPLSREQLDERRAGESVLQTPDCCPAGDGVRARRQGLGWQGRQRRRPSVRRSSQNLSGGLAGLPPVAPAEALSYWLRSQQLTDGGGPIPGNGCLVIEASERNPPAPQRCGRPTRFPLSARSRARDKKSASRRPRLRARSWPAGSGPLLRASPPHNCPTGGHGCQHEIRLGNAPQRSRILNRLARAKLRRAGSLSAVTAYAARCREVSA